MRLSFEVEGQEVFSQRLGKFAGDLDSPFIELDLADPLHSDFLEIEADQFQSGGHGSWPDLLPESEEAKTRKAGSVHFLMRLTDRLYFSLTRTGGDHVFDKSNPKELVMGTRVPYARAHMKSYKRRPARPPIDFRDEDKRKMMKTVKKQAAIYNRTKIGFTQTDVSDFD